MSHKFDVIIIGSGISSLTCAALLSKKGKSVCVLEKYSKPGGYLHCFNRFGHRFDTGAHYVGAMDEGEPFHTLLNYLGVYEKEHYVELDPEGFDVFKFPKFKVEIPKGYNEVISRLGELFPQEKEGIKKYFEKIRETGLRFPTYEFNENLDANSILDVLNTPLQRVVEDCTKNRDLQCVLYAYCTLHGVLPSDVSFGLHAVVTDSLLRGAYGFTQGGEALAQKYVKEIKKSGGEVFLRKGVCEISVKEKMATAVLTEDGDHFEAEWVISGIHPKATFDLVSDQTLFSPAFRQRLKNTKESVGLFGIYASVQKPPDLSPLKNYYYFGSADPVEILSARSPNAKPPAAFLSPANRSQSTLSGQTQNFSFNVHAIGPMEWFENWRKSKLGERDKAYTELKNTYAKNILDFIGDFENGFSSSDVPKFVTSTPLTNLHFNGSREGSSYGVYHSIENTGARALGPRTHVANLLLTGQSSLFPGLLGSAISALRTAGHIVGMKSLIKEIRESRGS